MALQIRRGTNAQRLSLGGVDTPVVGEPLFTTDTKKLFIGDGSTAGGVSLGYYGSIEVSGQGTLSAANNTDVLTLVAGRNIDITTDPATDTVTISADATFTELQNESIRIFQNNILGLKSNEDIIVNPSGAGKLVVSGTLNATEFSVGTFNSSASTYYFELEGGVERTFRTGGPGGLVSGEFRAYYATPNNGDKGYELFWRQTTDTFADQVIASQFSRLTNKSNGVEAGEFVFKTRHAGTFAERAVINQNGFVGNLLGNVTGNVSGNVNGIVTGTAGSSLTGNVTGNINGVVTGTAGSSLIGNVTGNLVGNMVGSVFADNSTILVDGVSGTLRGTHVGIFETPSLRIDDNTISALTSNEDLSINLLGTGALVVRNRITSTRLELYQNTATSGITLANTTATNANLIIANTHASASTSPSFVTNPTGFAGPQTGASVVFLRAKGSDALDPQTVANNDEIATMDFLGFFLPESSFYTAAKIKAVVDGNPGSSTVPGRLDFLTTNSSGTSAVRLTVSSSAVSSNVPYKLPVVADDTARTALVPSPSKGMMIFMESGTTPAATNVAQVYNGTNWVNL